MGWRAYQKTLPAPSRRPHLSIVRSCDLERYELPGRRRESAQLAALVVVLCIAGAAVVAVAAWIGGAW